MLASTRSAVEEGEVFAVLRERSVRALVVAEAISHAGTQMTFVALPWFVLTTTGSAARTGIVMAAEILPMVLLGVPSGTVVDRLGSRRTMLVSDLVRAGLMAAVPLAYAAGVLSFPLLVGLVAGLGVFIAPYMAAQRVLLPGLVGEDEAAVGQGNAYLQGAIRLAGFAGPMLAGLLIAVVEPTTVLFVDAATFIVSAAIIAAWIPTGRVEADGDDEVDARGVFDGARFLLKSRFFAPMLCGLAVMELAFQALFIALPVAVLELYGADPRLLGMFIGAFGLGALVGTFAVIPLLDRWHPLATAGIALVVESVTLWFLVLPLPVPLIVLTLFTVGLANPFANSPLFAAFTVRVPPRLRAQAMAATITFVMLAGPLGLAGAGPLLEILGPRPVFVLIAAVACTGSVVAAVVALRTWRRELRDGVVPSEPPVPVEAG